MSTRFLLAQLVERRIQSIIKDTRQLDATLLGMDIRPQSVCMVNGLYEVKIAARRICVLLAQLGEGETKQDDLPNLDETAPSFLSHGGDYPKQDKPDGVDIDMSEENKA